nr:DUF1176 domain-containing protein [uncultured Brevundimonas sp.]
MTLNGLWRGVVAFSALVLSALSIAGCGDRDAAKAPDATKAASPSAPAAAAPVLQIRPETKTFRDWSATCGNDGTCWAFGFAPEFAAGWVRITLAPGPDAQPQILFGYWPEGEAKGAGSLSLTIDGRAYPAVLGEASDAEAPVGEIRDGARTALDALAQGKVMIIRGASTQEVSLHGAAAALLWIDEKQGRLDTPTALIRRGDRPAALVPIAPPLPTITPAPAVDQAGFGDQNQRLPAALRARTEVGNCLKESATPDISDMVMSARLDARTELWAVPCGAGAYNLTHNWYLTGPGGRDPRPAVLAGSEGSGSDPVMPDNSTINGAYDPKTRTLSAFAKARGIGDCGAAQTWAWTGQGFTLTQESVMGECAGVPSDLWPVTWRTR